MKKLFGMLGCMLLALGLVPNLAFAAGNNQAKIGDTEYITLLAAVNAAEPGDTVTLLKDLPVGGGSGNNLLFALNISKPLTLDLNGFTLGRSDTVIKVSSDLTIKNGTIDMAPRSTSAQSTPAITIKGAGKLTIAADATVTTRHLLVEGTEPVYDLAWGVAFDGDANGAELIVDGTITGEGGIAVLGTITNNNNTITINDGAKIDVQGVALYQAGGANTTINGGTLSGSTAVEVRAGDITINGGTLNATADFSEKENNNGPTTTGVALAVSQHTTNLPINTTVNGGTLTGAKAFYEVDMQDQTGSENVVLNVAGGHYNGEVASQNHTEFVNAGVFNQPVEAAYVAPAKTEANLTSGENTAYYIGDAEQVASEIATDAKAGDTVEVTKGDLALENVAADVTVKNTGDGSVSVNHIVVPTGESVTTVETTDSEGISPQTSEALNFVAIMAIMLAASAVLSYAFFSGRKQRR